MIKLAVGPGGDGVARGACRSRRRKARGDVVGDVAANGLGLIPIGSVAGHAVRSVERVIVVDVACRTGSRSGGPVRANESEAGYRVIEGSGVPTLGGMAVGAIRRSKTRTRGGVNRVGGLLPLGEVATGIAAVGWGDLQIVIVVDVAGSAGNVGMSVGEQEAGGAVIKDRGIPTDGVVTSGAIGRGEGGTSGCVRRIAGLLPVG